MTTQIFVRPLGNCLQLIPLPIPSPCIKQSDICIQQLQNFLNAVKPSTTGGCITSDFALQVNLYAGDGDVNSGFLDPSLDYRTQFILTVFNDMNLTLPPLAIYNLCQVGIIQRVGPINDDQLTCIINTIPSTFNRCPDSLASQQLEAAATGLISTTDPVNINSENGSTLGPSFIRAVKPGIIITTQPGTAPYVAVIAYSTCFISSIRT